MNTMFLRPRACVGLLLLLGAGAAPAVPSATVPALFVGGVVPGIMACVLLIIPALYLSLKYNFGVNHPFVFFQYNGAKIFFERLTDNKNNFAKSGTFGIKNGIIHDGFTVGSQPVELLQTTVTAAHSGCKYK